MTDEPSSVIDITRKRAMINFGINGTGLLAQVNFGANSASVLGIFLAVAGAALYFLRTVRPELSRDQDIFFAAVGLLCGFILIFQGWRLDPILQFGQLLLVGSTVFFAVESIRLRSIATQQAKRNTPIVDDEREVSKKYSYSQRRNYQAEVDEDLDPLPYYEEEEAEPPQRPRIRGSRDDRSSQENYEDTPQRTTRPSSREQPDSRTKKRRTGYGSSSNRPNSYDSDENWGYPPRPVDNWETPPSETRKPSRPRKPQSPEFPQNEPPTRPRRRRPPVESFMSDEPINADYVPYNPIETPTRKPDNSDDLDDIS
ncbi:Ycf66 family protein [Raphidiopsis curvata NIES-932]|nr:Ycf66 family protein [Raphidiopsis curvata NIES-932]